MKKRESFPLSKELDGSPISPPTLPEKAKADLERAKEKLKPGVKSVFAKKLDAMRKALNPKKGKRK